MFFMVKVNWKFVQKTTKKMNYASVNGGKCF